MKKIILFFISAFVQLYHAQIASELKKEDIQKISTNKHVKALGLDINISYPVDWSKTDGKRPHMLFNLANPDKSISSTIGISNILESMTADEKKLFKSLSDKELKDVMVANFPTSTNCSEYFTDIGMENVKNSTCRMTKIEGLQSSVASTFGTLRRAEYSIDAYMIYYQVPYKTNLISISFNFQNVTSEQDRYLADNLSNKIMNSMIINNLWKK